MLGTDDTTTIVNQVVNTIEKEAPPFLEGASGIVNNGVGNISLNKTVDELVSEVTDVNGLVTALLDIRHVNPVATEIDTEFTVSDLGLKTDTAIEFTANFEWDRGKWMLNGILHPVTPPPRGELLSSVLQYSINGVAAPDRNMTMDGLNSSVTLQMTPTTLTKYAFKVAATYDGGTYTTDEIIKYTSLPCGTVDQYVDGVWITHPIASFDDNNRVTLADTQVEMQHNHSTTDILIPCTNITKVEQFEELVGWVVINSIVNVSKNWGGHPGSGDPRYMRVIWLGDLQRHISTKLRVTFNHDEELGGL